MKTLIAGLTVALCGAYAQGRQGGALNPDTTTWDPDGTAHITRVIPLPKSVSPEAQKLLSDGTNWAPGPNNAESKRLIALAQEIYPVVIEEATIAGVKVRRITPKGGVAPDKKDRVLINLHGGGFTVDSGSFLESIPIASLTKTEVVTVYYRLAPKDLFPAPVDDVVAVYKELLKTHRPDKMAIYGTSAGAGLTVMSIARFKHDGIPLPAAIGIFSGNGDSRQPTDSTAFFGVPGLVGAKVPQPGQRSAVLAQHDPNDPLASPITSDLKGWPSALCMTGTRDTALAGTVNFHRALLRAGVEAKLMVYDALPHAFWYEVGVPEAQEALAYQAKFLDSHLAK
jgi:acetyl esterase/lipase